MNEVLIRSNWKKKIVPLPPPLLPPFPDCCWIPVDCWGLDWELGVFRGVSAGDRGEFEGYKNWGGAVLVLGVVGDSQPISGAHTDTGCRD